MSLTTYCSPAEKEQIRAEVDEQDLSVSEYLWRLIEVQREAENASRFVEQFDAEQRVEQLVADGRDELADVADDVRDLSARGNIYNIALFELLKENYLDAKHSRRRRNGSVCRSTNIRT